jgi:hypothetical protein
MCSPFGFSIQQFFVCLFYCQKTAFVCEFQHIPLWKINFCQCSTPLLDMRFCRDIPNHLEMRIWRGTFHIYFKKWFFGLQNFATL